MAEVADGAQGVMAGLVPAIPKAQYAGKREKPCDSFLRRPAWMAGTARP